MTDLSKTPPAPPNPGVPSKGRPIRLNPAWAFLVPLLATVGTVGWWFYALLHDVHFPGGPYGDHAGAFNILLIVVDVALWIAAGALFVYLETDDDDS